MGVTMEVFLLIIGLFLIFLAITILYKERNSNEDSYSVNEEFSKLLLEKKRELEKDPIERKIDRINKEERALNSIEYNKKEFLMPEDLDTEREELFNLIRDKNVNNIIETPDNSKKNIENTSNSDRILAYRSGRSLVVNKTNDSDDLFSQIESLEREGYSVQDIAKKLNKGVREIEITKKINTKS